MEKKPKKKGSKKKAKLWLKRISVFLILLAVLAMYISSIFYF